jgi:hypothetical protein
MNEEKIKFINKNQNIDKIKLENRINVKPMTKAQKKHFFKSIRSGLIKIQSFFINKTQTKTFKEWIADIIFIVVYGVVLNLFVTTVSQGWFPFHWFTILGWGSGLFIIMDFMKFIKDEIMRN